MRLLRRLRAEFGVLLRARRNRADFARLFLRYLARRPALAAAVGVYEAAVMLSNRVDPRLKHLAQMKTASLAGCEFCLDLGSPISRSLGIDRATLADLPHHQESPRFTPLERAALDLAVAMTSTPARVEPELRGRLLERLTRGQLAELSSAIAWENHRARMNNALGVPPLGFADGQFCLAPQPDAPAEPQRTAVAG